MQNSNPLRNRPARDPLSQDSGKKSSDRTLGRFLFQAVSLAVIMMASLGGYLLVLNLRGPAATIVTYIPWDEWIPFHHGWVWVYLLPYLIGPVVIGLLTRETFRWYVKRGLTIVFLTLVIFLMVPTRTRERTEIPSGGDVTTRLYVMMIEIDDPPANAAPSLHISLTCLLALALWKDFPRWWWATGLGVSLVWVATMGTRQHHLIDVATGAALAFLIVMIWPGKSISPQGSMGPSA